MSKILPKILYFILFSMLIILYPFSINADYSKSMLIITLLISLVALIIFITVRERDKNLYRQYCKPSYIFLLGFLIVFFQIYIDLAIGNIDENQSVVFISPTVINQGAILVSCGLVLFFWGYYYYARKQHKEKVYDKKYIPIKVMRILFIIISLLYFATNIRFLLSGEYSQELLENRDATAGSYSERLFLMCYFSFLAISCVNLQLTKKKSVGEYVKYLGLPFHIIIFIFCILNFILTNRGPIIMVFLSYFITYIIVSKKKIGIKTIVIGIIGGAMFLSIIGVARKMNDSIGSYMDIYEAVQEFQDGGDTRYQSFSKPTRELANSIRTLHLSLNYINEGGDYFYGSFQTREILRVIPMATRYAQHFQDPHFKYRSSHFFITWLANGEIYEFGEGSSIIADLYLAFGVLGVFIGMFLLGMFLRKIDLIACAISPEKVTYLGVIAAIVVSASFSWSRGSYLGILLNIVWSYVFTIAYCSLMKNKNSSNERIES